MSARQPQVPPRLIVRTAPYTLTEGEQMHTLKPLSKRTVVALEIVALVLLAIALLWAAAHPVVAYSETRTPTAIKAPAKAAKPVHWHRVNASMYGGPNDPGQDSLASGVGKARKNRNIIAMRTGHVGDLYLIRYRRHSKWYTGLFMRGDYGPASWTHRQVDILWGGAKRLAFPGTGHVQIVKVGKLARKKWRKFTNYRNLAEAKRKLRF